MQSPPTSDVLLRFVFDRASVRGSLVRLDQSWQTILSRANYPPAVRHALGELVAASVLLAATVKFENGALVLQIQGGEPVTLLVVECQSDLALRAAARWVGAPSALGPHPPLSSLAAGARCALTLDPGAGMQAYQGVVPLEGETVAAVLERYMERSEQIETRFLFASSDETATGLLLQKLPAEGGRAARATDEDLWPRATLLARTLEPDEFLRTDPHEILRRLFHQEELRLFESLPVRFECRCSRERVAGMLRMIGAEEARAALGERGFLDVACDFCKQTYRFDREEAHRALSDDSASTPTPA
jgi:molecular chaperone Hsp33